MEYFLEYFFVNWIFNWIVFGNIDVIVNIFVSLVDNIFVYLKVIRIYNLGY